MSVADDLKADIAALNDATNLVAANITNLAAKIKNSMSDEEVADIRAQLAAEASRLSTLAVDPTNPVPPEPPQLVAARNAVKKH